MRLFLLLFTIICVIEAPQALDDEQWSHNTWYAETIANRIKNDTFNTYFGTSTLEEIDNTLKTLKQGLSFLQGERFANVMTLHSGVNQKWQIRLFKRKIKELKEKRKTLKAGHKCQNNFAQNTSQ